MATAPQQTAVATPRMHGVAIDPNWRRKPRLCANELAVIASESLRTIRAKIASGEIGSFKVGRLRFVPIAAALSYLHEPAPDPGRARADAALDQAAGEVLDRLTAGLR